MVTLFFRASAFSRQLFQVAVVVLVEVGGW